MSRSTEQSEDYAHAHEIDTNFVRMSGVMLWKKSTREFMKISKKELKNNISSLLNTIRRS